MQRGNRAFYKTRLRTKRQITLPDGISVLLSVEIGDDLIFTVNEHGQVIIEKAQTIPPDQAWFWTERWQRLEREAQADIEAGRVSRYANADAAISDLEKMINARDRDD